MGDMSVLIMEKDKDTGYLSREIGSYKIEEGIELIERVFAVNDNGSSTIYLYVTVPGDFLDWEFNAILDVYNYELYDNLVDSIEEDEDSYNPTWLIKFKLIENDDAMEDKLNEILKIHAGEIKRVLEAIKNLESEYNG